MVPEIVIGFLSSNSNIELGYSEITFFEPDQLLNEQIGYSKDADGNTLITVEEGCWESGWVVIGIDGLVGDPIFVDTNSNHLTVLTAVNGEGSWEPEIIADSFEKFVKIIADLKVLSNERNSPVELEHNPIDLTERTTFLDEVRKNNPLTSIEYWEIFLEQD
jgi:hypothetical protein